MSADPARLTHELDHVLRQCVECGLCLPHCATFQATGNEVQSPRGRLMVLGEMLQHPGAEIPTAFLEAFDQCIGCRACETACPGGVPFSLLEYGQSQAEARLVGNARSGSGQLTPGFVLPRLDRPWFLRLVKSGSSWTRALLALIWGENWRQTLQAGPLSGLSRLVASTPRSPETDGELVRLLTSLVPQQMPVEMSPAPGAGRVPSASVVFFRGCANEGLLGASAARVRQLLELAGCRVSEAPGQECCGALASHTGRPGRAAYLRRRNAAALEPLLDETSTLLVEAAGCGLELRERYPEDWTSRTRDVTVFLAGQCLPIRRSLPLKVVYHDPCHARHGQGIVEEPRELLRRIPGLTLVEPVEADVCCGSGGAWGLRHPELSAAIGRRKARDLAATGAQLVATSNPGCLGQIADGLAIEAPGLPILPLTDLLWFVCRPGD